MAGARKRNIEKSPQPKFVMVAFLKMYRISSSLSSPSKNVFFGPLIKELVQVLSMQLLYHLVVVNIAKLVS